MVDEKMELLEVKDGNAVISQSVQREFSKEEILGEINSLEASKKSFQEQIDIYQKQIDECNDKAKEWQDILDLLGA